MDDAAEAPIDDGDRPLDPEAMLALASDQRQIITGRLAAFVPVILLAWGIAWLVGFGVLWLIDGLSPTFSLPLPVAVVVFVVLMAAGIGVSAVLGIRASRGLRGNPGDAFAGAVYGWAWTIGGLAIVGFAQGLLFNGMKTELVNIYYPVAFVIFTGVMYILGAALWRAVPMLVLGVWTVAVGIAAPFFGYPGHYLWMALAGGGGLLVLSVASFGYLRRLRSRLDRAVHRG